MRRKSKASSHGAVKCITRARSKSSHFSISQTEPAEGPPKSSKMSSSSNASTKNDNGCVRCRKHKKRSPSKNCSCKKCNDSSDSLSVILDDSMSNSENEIKNSFPWTQSTPMRNSGPILRQSLNNLETFLLSKDDNLHNLLMWTTYTILKESQFDVNLAFSKLSEAQLELRSLRQSDPSFMLQYGFYPWNRHNLPLVSPFPIPMPYMPYRYQGMPNMSYAIEQPATLTASGQEYMWPPASNSEEISPFGTMTIVIPQQQANQ